MHMAIANGVCPIPISDRLRNSDWSDKQYLSQWYKLREKFLARSPPIVPGSLISGRTTKGEAWQVKRIRVNRSVIVMASSSPSSGAKDLQTMVLEKEVLGSKLGGGSSRDRRSLQVVSNDGFVDLEKQLRLSKVRKRNSSSCGISSRGKPLSSKGKVNNTMKEAEEMKIRSKGDADSLAQVGDDNNTLCEDGSSMSFSRGFRDLRSEIVVLDKVVEGRLKDDEDRRRVLIGPDSFESGRSEEGLIEIEEQLTRSLSQLRGGRLMADLMTAWDGLSERLAPYSATSKSVRLLLAALKLVISSLQRSGAENSQIMLSRSLAVAYTLADLNMDVETMAAGLLRNILDANMLSIDDVESQLGVMVGRLLHDCMRFKQVPSRVDILDDEAASAIRQFCLAYYDTRAVIIEVVTRLHTMRHIAHLPRYQQQILALECMQIHATLAHAVGTSSVSLELEDMAFEVLFPQSYRFVEKWLRNRWIDADVMVDTLRCSLSNAIHEDPEMQGLIHGFEISGRLKSRFSIMKKLLKDGRQVHEVFDVMGLRIVVDPKQGRGIEACYQALKIARDLWEEVSGRFKDYIAMPKSNGYSSLHTLFYLDSNVDKFRCMELQIRTTEMDAMAVGGPASHASYKGGVTDPDQVEQLKKLMMAVANRASLSLTELTRETMLLESEEADSRDEIFRLFDKNNDGVISMAELREVMGELGADKEDAQELMQLADTNTDGSLSSEEFANFQNQVRVLKGLTGVDKRFSNQLVQTIIDEGIRSDDRNLKNDSESNYLDTGMLNSDSTSAFDMQDQWVSGETYPGNRNASERIRRKPDIKVSPVLRLTVFKPVRYSQSLPKTPTSSSNIDSENVGYLDVSRSDVNGEVAAKDKHLEEGLKKLYRLISLQNISQAKGLVKQLSAGYPGNAKLLVEHAYLEARYGDMVAARALYAEAIEAFRKQKNMGYDYIRALKAWGSLEAKLRNVRRARYLFMESIHAAKQEELRSPEGNSNGAAVYALHAWAGLEEKLGNWSKARDLLMRAEEIQPHNAVVHQSRAMLEARAHNFSAARQHFQLAVESDPKDAICWQAWALFEAKQKRRPQMRQLFQKALEADPKNIPTLQAWAHQEALIGTSESKEKARTLFQKSLVLDPNNVHSLQGWALLEQSWGNYEKARELFQLGLRVNPEDVPCIQAFAHMERNLGHLELAQELLHVALKLQPKNAAVLMEAAIVEQKLGNSVTAADLFIQAGIADKIKNRVKRRIFESRKAAISPETKRQSRDSRPSPIRKKGTKPPSITTTKLKRQIGPLLEPPLERQMRVMGA